MKPYLARDLLLDSYIPLPLPPLFVPFRLFLFFVTTGPASLKIMSASTTSTTSTAYAQARRRQRGGGGDRDAMGNSTSGVEAKVVVMGSAGSSLHPNHQHPCPLTVLSSTLGVGKTSLVQRYTTNTFSSTKIAATAGASFHVKKTIVNGVPVRLQLWDTAGQERFRSLVSFSYFWIAFTTGQPEVAACLPCITGISKQP